MVGLKFTEWGAVGLSHMLICVYAFIIKFIISMRSCVVWSFIFRSLKCMILETRADSVVVKSNGMGPVFAAMMAPKDAFDIVVHMSWKTRPHNRVFYRNGICSSLYYYVFQGKKCVIILVLVGLTETSIVTW
jgi:hypothetical protein